MEIGPYRVGDESKGPKLEFNDGSWDEFANIMFVDNPVGTGFSFVDTDSYVRELPEMADQFITFLEKWFTLFPEYEHDDVSILCKIFSDLLIIAIALPCWGVLCRPTHPLHCKSDTRQKQGRSGTPMAT